MSNATPSCPRCGYDQSGVVESWRESCPLDGVCSECGLEFRWREVFFPGEIRVAGFYEHARGIAFVAAWKTLAWTLLPWLFWSKVRLEHPVRVRRMLLWLVVLLLPLQMLHATHVVAMRLWGPAWTGTTTRTVTITVPSLTVPSSLRPSSPTGTSVVQSSPVEWTGIVPHALDPILCQYNSSPQWPQAIGLAAGPPSGSFADVFADAAPGWKRWPIYSRALVALSAAIVVMLLILPQTRARAKVRPTHILRAAVYGSSWVVVFGFIRLADEAWFWALELFGGGAQQMPGIGGIPLVPGIYARTLSMHLAEHPWLVTWFVSAWILCWWLCALWIGFRIREWFVVWAAMAVPSVLAMVVVLCVLSQAFVQMIDMIFKGNVLRLW